MTERATLTNDQAWAILRTLGYAAAAAPPSPAAAAPEDLASVLAAYQRDRGLPATGELTGETAVHLRQPICGVAAGAAARALAPAGPLGLWDRADLTFAVINKPSYLRMADVVDAFEAAFVGWSQALLGDPACLPMRFVDVRAGTAADFTITFATGDHGCVSPFNAIGNQNVAHAFFPSDALNRGKLHFDDDRTWSVQAPDLIPAGTPSLVTFALHELGHALGLDHSGDPGSIMQAQPPSPLRTLAASDVAAIRAAYRRQAGGAIG